MLSQATPAATQRRPAKSAARPLASIQKVAASGAADAVRVALQRRTDGVLLQIEERAAGGGRVFVVAAFTEPSAFEAWSSDDPLRFEQPIVHQQLRRQAAELWRIDL